jgi:hypothetical protein
MTLLCALCYVLYNLICYGKAPQAKNIQLFSAYAICHAQLCALGLPPIFCMMSCLQVCIFEVTVMRDRTLDWKTTVGNRPLLHRGCQLPSKSLRLSNSKAMMSHLGSLQSLIVIEPPSYHPLTSSSPHNASTNALSKNCNTIYFNNHT